MVNMSWNNPSPEEAEEAYYSCRNKYIAAANQRYSAERSQNALTRHRNETLSTIEDCRSEKMNFNLRIEQIGEIIKCLEGSGGMLCSNVPESIEGANTALDRTDESYRSSVRCEGIAVTQLNDVFKTKTVCEDANSNDALEQYKAEKLRLEQVVEELERKMDMLTEQTENLSRKINECISLKYSGRIQMNSFAYSMNHFKKFM